MQRQYDDALCAVMREIKTLCDPAHILNPGIVVYGDALIRKLDRDYP